MRAATYRQLVPDQINGLAGFFEKVFFAFEYEAPRMAIPCVQDSAVRFGSLLGGFNAKRVTPIVSVLGWRRFQMNDSPVSAEFLLAGRI